MSRLAPYISRIPCAQEMLMTMSMWSRLASVKDMDLLECEVAGRQRQRCCLVRQWGQRVDGAGYKFVQYGHGLPAWG